MRNDDLSHSIDPNTNQTRLFVKLSPILCAHNGRIFFWFHDLEKNQREKNSRKKERNSEKREKKETLI